MMLKDIAKSMAKTICPVLNIIPIFTQNYGKNLGHL